MITLTGILLIIILFFILVYILINWRLELPSSKGYVRNYKQELATEKRNHPERMRQRAERNRARAELMKEGLVHKGDNKAVDHITPLSKGGSNSRSNLRVRNANANDSYQRTRSGAMKYKNQK